MASGPAQTQLADPSFFMQMDPSLSQPLYRDRLGRVAGGPVWSKGPIVEDRTASAISTTNVAQTLTAAQIIGGYIVPVQTSGGALTLTMPSSSSLLQALSAYLGDLDALPNSDASGNGEVRLFKFYIHNTSGAGSTWTMTAGAGTPTQTVVGTAAITSGQFSTWALKAQVSSTGVSSISVIRIA